MPIIKESVNTIEEKRAAILNMLNAKPLFRISRALALYIPKAWLQIYGWELDGKVWVKVEVEVNKIIISPVNKEIAIKMMEANNVQPTT